MTCYSPDIVRNVKPVLNKPVLNIKIWYIFWIDSLVAAIHETHCYSTTLQNMFLFVSSFFLKALERCVEHPEEVGPLFKKYDRKLYMHVLFCKNKPFSEHIVSEYIDTYFAVS